MIWTRHFFQQFNDNTPAMGIARHESLSDCFMAHKGDVPLITRFTALFAIVSNNRALPLTTFENMRLGININNDEGLSRASPMAKEKLMVDRIQLANMPFAKLVEVFVSGGLVKKPPQPQEVGQFGLCRKPLGDLGNPLDS